MMYVTMVAQEEQPGQGRQHQRKKGRLEMRSKANVLSFVLIILIAGMTALFAGCGASGNADAEAGADASGEAGADALKEFSDKPWVYDAEYDIPTDVESYTTYNELIQVSDLVVPYINIDSPDAKAANEEIYGVYEELIDAFNECARTADEYEGAGYSVSDYEAYILDDAVSVLVTRTTGGTDVPWHDYYSYSFSPEDGRLLTYEEACEIAGITVEQAGETVKNNIRESTLKDYPDVPDIENYIAQSIDNYETSVSNGTIRFLLHDEELLDVVVEKRFPAGGGRGNEVIPAK